MSERIDRWLASPHVVWLAGLVAVVLASPSLAAGLQTEDFVHRAVSQSHRGWFDLFAGSDTPLSDNQHSMNVGRLPWLTAPDWRLAFWRPVASWTHHVDYRLWPNSPWLMHLQSLLWLGGLAAAATALYRRILGPIWVAGLAAMLYAIDDGHGPATGWLANRSTLMASSFAVLALLAHDSWRRGGRISAAVAAPILLAIATCCGEISLGIAGYFTAHALFLEPATGPRRWLAQLPWAVTLAVWVIGYRLGGFGVTGSGAYLDPFEQPGDLAGAALTRLPQLLQGVFAAPSTDFLVFYDEYTWAFATVGLSFLGLAIWALPGVLRHEPTARFWALGAVLAIVPGLTAMPADRLLFLPGIGAFALVALTVRRARVLWNQPGGRAPAVLAGGFLLVHGVSAPVLLPFRSFGIQPHEEWVRAAASEAIAQSRGAAELVVVNAPDLYTGSLLVAVREARGEPVPKRTRVLYGGESALVVRRASPNTLLVRPEASYSHPEVNRVFRGRTRPMHSRDVVKLEGMEALVTEVDDRGAPTEVQFSFPSSLEDAGRAWVVHDGSSYVGFELPPVGGERRIEALKVW